MLTCPANVELLDVVGASQPVSYAPPVATGGTPPTSVTCTPPSGSSFPLGPTAVVCTATDSAGRTASCGFSVTLVPVPVSRATRIMAFGDSLTAGEVQLAPSEAGLLAVDAGVAYPTVMQKVLQARYKSQIIAVSNQGRSGESAVDGTSRLSSVVQAERPEVLMVLQGVIDLSAGGSSAIPAVVEALKFDIRDARRRGVTYVFVSTLLPQKPGSRAFAIDEIVPANTEIRSLVAREGALLLDGYAALAGREATLIGADGLHPVAEGYEVLGTYYANEMIRVLDAPPPVSPLPAGSDRLLRRPNVEVRPETPRPTVRLRKRE